MFATKQPLSIKTLKLAKFEFFHKASILQIKIPLALIEKSPCKSNLFNFWLKGLCMTPYYLPKHDPSEPGHTQTTNLYNFNHGFTSVHSGNFKYFSTLHWNWQLSKGHHGLVDETCVDSNDEHQYNLFQSIYPEYILLCPTIPSYLKHAWSRWIGYHPSHTSIH